MTSCLLGRCFVVVMPLFVVGHIAQAADKSGWPQWRGPNRDARSEETGLLKEWPEGGPPIVWQTDKAGVGYSSLSVHDGRVFTQGDLEGIEHVIAFRESDGTLLWAAQPEPVARNLEIQVEQQLVRLDRDGDGKLDELEALNGLGLGAGDAETAEQGDAATIARARVARLMLQLDENGDGQLSYLEVPRAMQQNFPRIDAVAPDADAQALAQQRAAANIKDADADGDGKVTLQEARESVLGILFRRIDQRPPGERRGDEVLTQEEIVTYFATSERGRDGVLTTGELQRYYEETYPGRDGILMRADVRRYLGGYRNSYGDGPRGTPTVEGNRVYAEGGNGDVTCLDAATGTTIWHVNLVADLGGGRPGWGYAESPLVIDNLVIVTPGGRQGTVAALDKLDGSVVWRSTGVTDNTQYSSPMLAALAGQRQIVQLGYDGVFGVALDDGEFLWRYDGANNRTANVASPLVDRGHVLVSTGYNAGAGLVKISAGAGRQQLADEVYLEKRLTNHHGGLVLVDGYVYAFNYQSLMCMEFLTGKIAWQARSVGKGSLMFADGHLYCLGERNELALVEANPDRYVEKGRIRLSRSDRPSWAHPVVANGRLYVRDQRSLVCYDVGSPQ